MLDTEYTELESDLAKEKRVQTFMHAAGLQWLSEADFSALVKLFPTWYSKRDMYPVGPAWTRNWSEYTHRDGMPEAVLDQIEAYQEIFDDMAIATTEVPRTRDIDPLLLGVKRFGSTRRYVILAQWGQEELADIQTALKWVRAYTRTRINDSALRISWWLVACSMIMCIVWMMAFNLHAPIVFYVQWGIINLILGSLLGSGLAYPVLKRFFMEWQARTRPELVPLKSRLLRADSFEG